MSDVHVVTAVLTEGAFDALCRIQRRMNDSNVDEIVSAALVIYDMHQAAMVSQLEHLESSGEVRRMNENE